MDLIVEGLRQASSLLLSGDPELWRVIWLSLQVSGSATALSLLLGVPAGTFLALNDFPGRRVVISLVNTGMGLPPVVVGLFVTILLWRNGPLGLLRLLYTPAAMVIAQCVIAAPIVTGLTMAAMQSLNPKLRLQILALGASRAQLLWLLMREARLPLLAAVMAGFGGVISEIGASMMVGGNIQGQTRVLTTATVMETSKGNFALAIALGLVLLAIMFVVNSTLTAIQQRRRPL
jgi:tungstate transport system permease protein